MVQDAWPIPTPATTSSCLDRISGQWVAGLLLFKPQIAHVLLASKTGKKKKHVLFTTLLYPISTQLQDNYSKIGLACFSKEDGDFWDSTDEGILNRPCLQVKRQLYQLIEEVTLRTFEKTISTVPEKQLSTPPLPRGRRPQRVAAHITGITRRSNSALIPISKDGKTLGQKIETWESSRRGHSFLNHVHLRNGELVIQEEGLYYIYSQTYYRFKEAKEASKTVSKDGGRIKQMVQYIYKYTSYPDPILLMKSARNSCWSREAEYGLYSIYQGGLFELKENDRIFVSVTNEHLMDLDQEASFFGAFLIN